jgi:tetratricopeptide (TPR) repeat protein
VMLGPFVGPATRAARAWAAFEPTPEGVRAASDADPRSARPWTRYGRGLAASGRFPEALLSYQEAHRRIDHHWAPRVVFPRLLAESGRPEEARQATQVAHALSRTADPWLMLEVAWRELPPPRGTSVDLGGDDYGAARGFELPEDGGRWSRHRAWLRILPAEAARAYDVTLEMSSPDPSPQPHPEVVVGVQGGARSRFTLAPERRGYVLRTPAPSEGLLLLRLDTPTWTRAGHPAGLGVLVHRMTLAPVRE